MIAVLKGFQMLKKVHRVIPGTLAERDGRILKGDRVLSINGKSTKGVTHRDALAILKVKVFTKLTYILVSSSVNSIFPGPKSRSCSGSLQKPNRRNSKFTCN